jgi:hypothetical protein
VDTTNLERYLQSFGNYVKKESRELLNNAKGNTNLENTIRFEVEPDADGFSVKFYMAPYGTYLDKGVSGTKQKQTYQNYNGSTVTTDYKYTTRQPPPDILSRWIKRKGIKPKGLGRGRDKDTGRYISNLAFLIGKKIKRDGIKSLSFFQIPLGIGYRNLKKEMLQELKLDIQTYLTDFY